MKKNARGYYQKQITIEVNGVKKQKGFFAKTIKELNQKLLEYVGEVEKGKLFENIVKEWETEHYKTITYGTARSYKAAKERLVKKFGLRYINDIKTTDITAYLHSFASEGYAHKTVKNLLLVANLIFEFAANKGYIDLTPTQYVKVPKNLPKKKRETPTEEEILTVKNSINCTFGLFAFFLLYTGCRKGEALALQYRDIDLTNKVIKISKSVYYISNKAELKQPKTEAGNREITLIDTLSQKLPKGENDHFIFSDTGTEPMTAKTFIVRWKQYQEETGLNITPHQLRHAYATRLYELGVDVKSAQDLLGHANQSTTQDIYTHITKTKRMMNAEQLKNF